MFKKAKNYADKNGIKIIATGEVLGQRPMSQIPSAMKIIDEDVSFEILRPLCAKKIKETSFEKSGKINRDNLFGISGRGRKDQIKLAKKYKIEYPSPGGGCFLCEKALSSRMKYLLKNNLIEEQTLPLVTIGRHFSIDDTWFVVARDEKESQTIANFENNISDDIGKPAVYYSDESQKTKAIELQNAYSTGDNKKARDKFKKYKL